MISKQELHLETSWDKTFPKSDSVNHSKVTFVNRYGITLAADMYVPKDAYADMIKDSKYADNKELMIIPDAVHTDLYDGGNKNAIPFDKLDSFFKEYI